MLSTPFYLSCWVVQSIMPTLSHIVPVWDTVLSSKQPQERKKAQVGKKPQVGKKAFLPTFGWRFLTRIKAAQRLNGHFISLGVHLVLTVNWKWAVLQLSHRLFFRCYLYPKCHFHREVLLHSAEMPFSSLLPFFSLRTIYLNNYYPSGIGL